FRGFPHMPGNDFVVTVARPGTGTANGQSRLF
ncbi:MAG: beta tubulin, partial [Hyphomicrobiaceae bacterium]|nr:beta tubulin [Hyphomicrobiaceae bacterium]